MVVPVVPVDKILEFLNEMFSGFAASELVDIHQDLYCLLELQADYADVHRLLFALLLLLFCGLLRLLLLGLFALFALLSLLFLLAFFCLLLCVLFALLFIFPVDLFLLLAFFHLFIFFYEVAFLLLFIFILLLITFLHFIIHFFLLITRVSSQRRKPIIIYAFWYNLEQGIAFQWNLILLIASPCHFLHLLTRAELLTDLLRL
jgi:hypothetical protein